MELLWNLDVVQVTGRNVREVSVLNSNSLRTRVGVLLRLTNKELLEHDYER